MKRSYLGDYEMTVIPNGVDLDRFKPRENDVKARLGIEGRTMLLGVAFKWLSVKGLDNFVALASAMERLEGIDTKSVLKRKNLAYLMREMGSQSLATLLFYDYYFMITIK